MKGRTKASATIVAGVCMLFAERGAAGPITPPPGPVASTHKTLSEVEPRIAINAVNTPGDADSVYRISQPGSYYLTGNIGGFSGSHGIKIVASNVTIDLNGFALQGIPGSLGSLDGIVASGANIQNISIRNGTVRAWGRSGVNFSIGVRNARIEDVHASGNDRFGIFAPSGSTIMNCTASNNGDDGIITADACTIVNCAATENVSTGISVGAGCTLTGCSAFQNQVGISTSVGSTMANCSSYDNTFWGVSTGAAVSLLNCSASSNGSDGFFLGTGNSLVDCNASFNTDNGVSASSACMIRGCTFFQNGRDGDGAGIRLTGSDNRIEGNTCVGADRGVDVDFPGNFIVRNICSDNTINWAIVASNFPAPIIIGSGNAAAINGNSYSGSLGSTDPNANFTY